MPRKKYKMYIKSSKNYIREKAMWQNINLWWWMKGIVSYLYYSYNPVSLELFRKSKLATTKVLARMWYRGSPHTAGGVEMDRITMDSNLTVI